MPWNRIACKRETFEHAIISRFVCSSRGKVDKRVEIPIFWLLKLISGWRQADIRQSDGFFAQPAGSFRAGWWMTLTG